MFGSNVILISATTALKYVKVEVEFGSNVILISATTIVDKNYLPHYLTILNPILNFFIPFQSSFTMI